MQKVCRACGEPKDAENDFYACACARYRDGRFPYCKVCHRGRSERWKQEHPEQHKAISRNWKRNHRTQARLHNLRSKFKIDFEAMWEAQKGLCACCGEPMLPEGRKPQSVCVDHDRSCCPGQKSCGKCVRGLIHWACNLVLGYAQDDPRILRYAAEYVERWSREGNPHHSPVEPLSLRPDAHPL